MSEDRAWAAGLFDGEGSIFASTHNRPDGREHVRLHMALAMTTELAVRRFAAVVDVGNVVYLPNQTGNRKPQWRWQTTANDDVESAIGLLLPWLSEHKIVQANTALEKRRAFLAAPRYLPPHQRPQRWCKRGHDLAFTRYVAPGGGSYCRECQKLRRKRDDAPLLNTGLEVVA